MKSLFAGLFMLLSISYAATAQSVQFKPNTELPLELRAKVSVAVSRQCPNLINLFENVTTVRVDKVDQGVIDYFYTTTINAEVAVDQFEYVPVLVVVNSAVYAHNNPTAGDNTVVEAVSCQ